MTANTTMTDGANERLDAQIAEALFGQPGMSKMDVANRVRELRGDGPALLVVVQPGGRVRLGDALLPCPFCGSPARRIDFGVGSGENEGGSCIECTGCQASGPVEFGYKENFISNWNRRVRSAQPSPDGQDALAALPLYRLADDAKGNRGLHRDDTGSWVKLQDVERALAARQPFRIYGCCAQPEGELHTAECPNMWHLAARQPDAAIGGHAHEIEDPCDVITRAAQKLSAAGQPRIADRLVSARTEVERLQAAYLAAHQPVGHVPAGFVLVPEKFGIPADVWEGVEFVIGGPSTGEGEAYLDSTAWIGDLMQDDGSSIYGLHLSCDECPEEGCVTLAEFAPPTAQAVDQGRWSQGHAEDLEQAIHTALSQKKRKAISDYVKRLLIDGKAVGK